MKDQWLNTMALIDDPVVFDHWMEDFQDKLNKIMTRCFRIGYMSHKPKLVWFTQKLKKARNRIGSLYKRAFRNLENEEYRESYRIAKRNYTKLIKQVKKKAWENFCSKTDDAFGNLYKHISGKSLQHTDMIHTVMEESCKKDGYDEVAELLMKEHFHIHQPILYPHEFIPDRTLKNDDEVVPLICTRELKFVLGKQAINKAPGPDRVDALVIRNLCRKHGKLILNINFNKCLQMCYFPKIWKIGEVIFFRKRHKAASNPRGYRPIYIAKYAWQIIRKNFKNKNCYSTGN